VPYDTSPNHSLQQGKSMTITVLDNQTVACEYIKQGFPVLPLCWPGSDRSCGCGRHHQEKAIGKAPLTDHGLKDATQTILGVKEYWNRWPQANIGIAIPSGYFILDVDIEHSGFESLELLQDRVGTLPDTWRITTGSGGVHLWYKSNIPIRNTVSLGGFQGIDVRGEGGYVVAPPSLHRNGRRYEVAEDYPIIEAPEALIALCSCRQVTLQTASTIGETIPEGKRNQTLASFAGSMRRRGMSQSAIEAALQISNREQCLPPLAEEEVTGIAQSVATYSPEPSNGNKDSVYTYTKSSVSDINHYQTITEIITKDGFEPESITSQRIEEWVREASGWFTTDELDRDLGIRSPEEKNIRRVCICRLKKNGIIEQHPRQNKQYRRVDKEVATIDFKSARSRLPLDLKYPFEIEKMVNIFPKSIIVVAGTPNAGKTAWLLNFTKLNMFSHGIYYFSSEMGDAELALRLSKFRELGIDEWNFTAKERSSNFADVIQPDCINIIDFLEIDHDFNEIAGQIRQIYDKLTSGIAVVAIQKNPGVDLGRGGTFSLEKARLYITMDAGISTITKAKNFANPGINPNHMKVKYKIVNGCEFKIERDWYKEL
jgi:hypothetical protein